MCQDDIRRFVEIAEEWGVDEVTAEDAQWGWRGKCRCHDDGSAPVGRFDPRDQEEAVLRWLRPGRWDRW